MVQWTKRGRQEIQHRQLLDKQLVYEEFGMLSSLTEVTQFSTNTNNSLGAYIREALAQYT